MADEIVSGYATMDWAAEAAQRWASQADRLEAQLAPVSDVLFEIANLQPGERVLDVGCGRGATTRDAALAVGASGWATGADVGGPLIDEARVLGAEIPNLDFLLVDAQRHEFEPRSFDAVISRFGVMFFDDAVDAFANLRKAARVGGRLAVAVWQPRAASEIMSAPLHLGVAIMEQLGHSVELPPADGGPFSLGDEARALNVLAQAGWSNARVARHDVELYNGGPGPVEDAVDVALTIGPLRALLTDLPAQVTTDVRSALTEDFTRRHDGTGVKFQGAISILTATNQ